MPNKYGVKQLENTKPYQEDRYMSADLYCEEAVNALLKLDNNQKNDFFTQLFQKIDADVKAKLGSVAYDEGSTAAFTVTFSNQICSMLIGDGGNYAAIYNNTGDLLGVKQLNTKIHDLKEEEKKRIEECGGKIFRGRVNGSLNVARGLGDYAHLGKDDVKLIVPNPQVDIYNVDDLLSAYEGASKIQIINVCDGITDPVYKGYNPELHENMIKDAINDALLEIKKISSALTDQDVANKIVAYAYKSDLNTNGKGMDNMTAVVKTVYDANLSDKEALSGKLSLNGVFDGHGENNGHKVAQYVADNIEDKFKNHIKEFFNQKLAQNDDQSIENQIQKEFKFTATNRIFLQQEPTQNIINLIIKMPMHAHRELIDFIYTYRWMTGAYDYISNLWYSESNKNYYCFDADNPIKKQLIEFARCATLEPREYIYLLMPSLSINKNFLVSNESIDLTYEPLSDFFVTEDGQYLLYVDDIIQNYKKTGELSNHYTSNKLSAHEINQLQTSQHAEKFKQAKLEVEAMRAKAMVANSKQQIDLGEDNSKSNGGSQSEPTKTTYTGSPKTKNKINFKEHIQLPAHLKTSFIVNLLEQLNNKATGKYAKKGNCFFGDKSYINIPKGLYTALWEIINSDNKISQENKINQEIFNKLQIYAQSLIKNKKQDKPYKADGIEDLWGYRDSATRKLYADLLNAESLEGFIKTEQNTKPEHCNEDDQQNLMQ